MKIIEIKACIDDQMQNFSTINHSQIVPRLFNLHLEVVTLIFISNIGGYLIILCVLNKEILQQSQFRRGLPAHYLLDSVQCLQQLHQNK